MKKIAAFIFILGIFYPSLLFASYQEDNLQNPYLLKKSFPKQIQSKNDEQNVVESLSDEDQALIVSTLPLENKTDKDIFLFMMMLFFIGIVFLFIIKKINIQSDDKNFGFDFFQFTDIYPLIEFLKKEKPQTIALVLAYLAPKKAAQVLQTFSAEEQKEIILCLAEKKDISPAIMAQIEGEIKKWFCSLENKVIGGEEQVVKILQYVSRKIKNKLLKDIAKTHGNLYKALS